MIQCCDRIPNKHGKTASGQQRYKCPLCEKTMTAMVGTPGRKLIGDRQLTNAERKRRQAEKRKYGEATYKPIDLP